MDLLLRHEPLCGMALVGAAKGDQPAKSDRIVVSLLS